ncbi:hypothetical protein [Gemella morbillorum]
MSNKIIVTKVIIKNIGHLEVSNSYNYSKGLSNNHIKVEFITNELDVYSGESIPRHINVIFNFNYGNYQDAFEKIFLPYIRVDTAGKYMVNDVIGKEFIAIFHLKYNEFYDNTYYLIRNLLSKKHAYLLLNDEKEGISNE